MIPAAALIAAAVVAYGLFASDEEAAELYATPKLRPALYTAEAVRVLREGGWLVVYGDKEPARPARCNHTLRIVVVLRPHHRPRIAGVFQKRKPGMPHYGTEDGELVLLAAGAVAEGVA